MVVGIILFVGLVGLWVWAEYERNKREDKLKERVDQLEKWVESVQRQNNY